MQLQPYLLGASLPFALASLTISATADGAFKMVDEVRRQFREIPGLREGTGEPDYGKCVDISTSFALKKMVFPAVLGIAIPVIIGLGFGISCVRHASSRCNGFMCHDRLLL